MVIVKTLHSRLLILCLQHLQGKLSLLLESLEAAAEESSPAALFSRLHTAFEGAERKDSTTEEVCHCGPVDASRMAPL